MGKIEVMRSGDGAIIAFRANSLHFLSLTDVQEFLRINKNFSIFDIKTSYYYLGVPDFVNIKATIENAGKVVFYDWEELLLTNPKDSDFKEI
jgi:hypothetical protein